MEPNQVERVAQAICEASGETWRTGEGLREPFASNAEALNNHWRYKATAAISAMPDSYDRGWNAAIEAAAKVADGHDFAQYENGGVLPRWAASQIAQSITALKKPTDNLAPTNQNPIK